ncbi:MAG: hypothetical protein WAL25_14055, partial [Acidimicrobiia bacterium]
MVLPDGAPRPERRRTRAGGTALVTLAVAGLVIGLLTLFATTSSEPGSDEDPQADAVAPEPGWRKVRTLPNGAAYALLSLNDEFLVFTSVSRSGDPNLDGLQVWTSRDGLEWVGSDPVIEAGNEVHLVVSNALGIVAIGHVPNDTDDRAWLSAHGDTWLPLMDGLPLDPEDIPEGRPDSLFPDPAGPGGDIAAEIGPDRRVIGLSVIETRKVALVAQTLDRGRSHDLERFEIW